jgi:hypothetical protein
MIKIISESDKLVAFQVRDIEEAEYRQIIIPTVEKLLKRCNEINFLLVLEFEVDKFTFPLWTEDAIMGLKKLGKWNRVAIVSDSYRIVSLANSFNYFFSGKFKGFTKDSFNEAYKWAEGF